LTLYTFETEPGCPDTYTTMNAAEARERGERYGMIVVTNEYE